MSEARGDVLVVDDNPTNLKLLAVLLRAEGHRVRTARHAEEALAALSAAPADLVLMDLQMPGMDGLALTRQLRADPATRTLKIVAVTAFAMKGDEERAREAGCDGYITKPIDTRALACLVADLLAARVRK